MMGTASLPTPQASNPTGFAAFLTAIGQAPTGGGEDGGFDQLLAAAPMPVATSVATAASAPLAASPALSVGVAPIDLPAPVGAPATATTAPTAETHSARAADTDAAAAAADLLIAINGNAPRPQPTTAPAAETKADADPDTGGTPDTGASPAHAGAPDTADIVADPMATTPAAVAAIPIVAALIAPLVGKPANTGDAAATAVNDAAPAPELPASSPGGHPRPVAIKVGAPAHDSTAVALPVADKPRATPTLPVAAAAAEAQATKPADAAPSITVQFAAPTAPGAPLFAGAAAPGAVTERMLDLASDGAWIDQLAHDIAATKSDSGDVSFRLMPRHLGRLDVAMLMGDEGVSLKLDTQHEAAATIVTAAQARLVDELRQQGVRVTASEVTCTPGDSGRQMQGQSQGQGRAAPHDVSHLIETVTERAKARDPEEAANRRGRFA